MKGLNPTSWRCGEALSPRCRGSDARPSPATLLAPFSTSLSLALLERLRTAATQLGLCECEVAAEAIERLLAEEGF